MHYTTTKKVIGRSDDVKKYLSDSDWFECKDCWNNDSPFKFCQFHMDLLTESMDKLHGWAMKEISIGLMKIHAAHIGDPHCLWFYHDEASVLQCMHGLVLHDPSAVIWTMGGGRN